MSVISEEEIVQAILDKEEIALNYVLDKYGNLIKSIISKHMKLLQMYQEECFNDVLLGIWDNAERYDNEKSSFKNWVAGVARYKALSYVRKYINDSSVDDIDGAYDLADEKAERTLLEVEYDSEFEQLIDGLNDQDKELFRRLYLHEQDVNEISSDMNLSSGIIYNRLSRGKKKLRTFLGGKGK